MMMSDHSATSFVRAQHQIVQEQLVAAGHE